VLQRAETFALGVWRAGNASSVHGPKLLYFFVLLKRPSKNAISEHLKFYSGLNNLQVWRNFLSLA
jgi:hypothetical protein